MSRGKSAVAILIDLALLARGDGHRLGQKTMIDPKRDAEMFVRLQVALARRLSAYDKYFDCMEAMERAWQEFEKVLKSLTARYVRSQEAVKRADTRVDDILEASGYPEIQKRVTAERAHTVLDSVLAKRKKV